MRRLNRTTTGILNWQVECPKPHHCPLKTSEGASDIRATPRHWAETGADGAGASTRIPFGCSYFTRNERFVKTDKRQISTQKDRVTSVAQAPGATLGHYVFGDATLAGRHVPATRLTGRVLRQRARPGRGRAPDTEIGVLLVTRHPFIKKRESPAARDYLVNPYDGSAATSQGSAGPAFPEKRPSA